MRESVLGVGEALICGAAVPLRRLDVVLRNTVTGVVHAPKLVLSFCVALLGERAVQAQCGRVIAPLVSHTRIVKRAGTCAGLAAP